MPLNGRNKAEKQLGKSKHEPAIAAMHGPHSVTVQIYTVMLEVCRWLTNEKQRTLIFV